MDSIGHIGIQGHIDKSGTIPPLALSPTSLNLNPTNIPTSTASSSC